MVAGYILLKNRRKKPHHQHSPLQRTVSVRSRGVHVQRYPKLYTVEISGTWRSGEAAIVSCTRTSVEPTPARHRIASAVDARALYLPFPRSLAGAWPRLLDGRILGQTPRRACRCNPPTASSTATDAMMSRSAITLLERFVPIKNF